MSITIYDGVMALIVVYTVFHGFWRGAAWQIAPIISLVMGYMIAMPMSITTAHWFGQPPLNRLFALVTIYLVVSLTVYLFFRSFRDGVEKAQLTEFDRHLGAILGGVKGVIITLSATCILLIYFPMSRETILKSNSSTIASKLIGKIYPILPKAMHEILGPYLNKLDDQLPIQYDDPQVDAEGFLRPVQPVQRSTSRKPTRFEDDPTAPLPPRSEDRGFEMPTARNRTTPRTPTLRDDEFSQPARRSEFNSSTRLDEFSNPARRDDFGSGRTTPTPAPSRTKRPIERSAEEVDPFDAADPDRAARQFK